jgi:hypothetical protein
MKPSRRLGSARSTRRTAAATPQLRADRAALPCRALCQATVEDVREALTTGLRPASAWQIVLRVKSLLCLADDERPMRLCHQIAVLDG